MIYSSLFSCLALVLTIPSFTEAAPTQQAVSDFIASEVRSNTNSPSFKASKIYTIISQSNKGFISSGPIMSNGETLLKTIRPKQIRLVSILS